MVAFDPHDVLDPLGKELPCLDLRVDGLGTFLVALEWDVDIEHLKTCALDVCHFLVQEDLVKASQ